LQFALVISVLLHLAILGATLVSLQTRQPLRMAEPEAVAVGMIAPSEVTKVRLGTRTAKLLEAAAKESPKGEVAKKEAAKAKVAAAAAPAPPPPPPEQKSEPPAAKTAEPPPPVAAAPAPVPPAEAQKKLEVERQEAERQAALKAEAQKQAEEQAKAEEQKKAAEKKRLEEQKKAEAQKRLEEERRKAELKKKRELALKKKREEEKKRREAEAAKKQKFNADKIAALLNKVPDAAPPPPSAPSEAPTKAKGPTLGSAEGRDKEISASELSMLKGRISARLKACWRLPSGGGGSDTPVVTLRWRLKPDGSLDGEPLVDRPRNDPLFLLAAEAAQRAVRECSPFDLPPDKYSIWRNITWDFDPRQML
jgi:colicin import membrane protein